MRSDRDYLRWCLRQSKGIRLVRPSGNLAKAYLKKSRSALRSMKVNAENGIEDWAISAAYYAKYFSVYALLSNLGVKSEIHDCTIALFAYLFRGSVSPGLVEGLRRSKRDRVETQYYTGEVGLDLGEMSVETNRFVLEMEKVLDGLNTRRIAELRENLKKDIGS